MIIPTFLSGLREHLIDCAGDIHEKTLSSKRNQIPFITETTAGNLKCQKLLFVNWSLSMQTTKDEVLIGSLQFFLSRVFDYIIKYDKTDNGKVRSIAMAMPEIFQDEQIFCEEFLDEMINQIHSTKSSSFRVSLIFLPGQQKFYQKLIHVLRLYQNNEDMYGIFYCPITGNRSFPFDELQFVLFLVLTITLMTLEKENLDRFQKHIETYLKRSMWRKKLNGFDHWNQHFISQFYSLAQDKSVLLKSNDQQQVILHGSVTDVEQVYYQYQLISLSIQIRKNCPLESPKFTLMLNYSAKDSTIGQRIFTHLINDGFRVFIRSDSFEDNSTTVNEVNLILFCISENSLDDDSFREELISAEEMGKILIPIQIESYRPTRWLRKLIENQIIFRLSGSDDYFNQEYQKLSLKIVSQSFLQTNFLKKFTLVSTAACWNKQ